VSNLLERFGRTLAAGEVLFKEHDKGEHMYVIQSGKVRITKRVRGAERVLADLAAGEFFGEMAILNNKPRMATATVLEDAKLLVIDPKTFEAMIKANTEIAVRMIKKLARRLDDADDQIETLLLRDTNSRVVHCLINIARASGKQSDAGIHVELNVMDIMARTGIDDDRIEGVLERMQRSQLLQRQGAMVLIPSLAKLEEFLEFLEMREKFGQV
jgi:CRP/FNR family cyclic AMP-dependent transcriptional regulator